MSFRVKVVSFREKLCHLGLSLRHLASTTKKYFSNHF